MRIAVIGTGHVGVPTCVALSHIGHHVVGTDLDQEKIGGLQQGIPPFFEPGLPEALVTELRSGRLRFASSSGEAIPESEVLFLCVATEPESDGRANLDALERAARDVARFATGDPVVVEKSTVPSGTSERLRRMLADSGREIDLEVVSNPEFLRQGSALRDALDPERILIGADSARGFEVMRRVYDPLISRGHRVIETDVRTAELAKYACNSFLALKISYANALASLCERMGLDVGVVTEVMGADTRIGGAFLSPGLGFGGSCLPKDLVAFELLASDHGYEFPLLREIRALNEEALFSVLRKVEDATGGMKGKRICLLGLSYKPNTDDVRGSPAIELARRLMAGGAEVVGYDPQAMPNAKSEMGSLELASDPYEASSAADCLVICTEWSEFAHIDLERMKREMRSPVVVDARMVLNPDDVRRARVEYYPTGSPPSIPS
ncbi:MAG: UDP-glucose dehydrogenase family protein [Actinomycetota bacterium]